jgi:hypothetical protein
MSSLLTRLSFFFLLFSLSACFSKEKETVAPAKKPVASALSLVGRWDVIEASITYYEPNGKYLRTSILPEEGKKYYLFFDNGKFERHTKSGSFEVGSYVYSNTSLTLVFSHGTYNCTIPPAINDMSLTLIEDTRNLTTVPENRRNRVILAQLKKNL